MLGNLSFHPGNGASAIPLRRHSGRSHQPANPDGITQQADAGSLNLANIALKSARKNKLSCQVYDPIKNPRSYEANLNLGQSPEEGR